VHGYAYGDGGYHQRVKSRLLLATCRNRTLHPSMIGVSETQYTPRPPDAAGLRALPPPGLDGPTMAAVFDAVRLRTGVDFKPYRRATIERRIRTRMIAAGVNCPQAYLARLAGDTAEPLRLLKCLTIKVSRFYRDPITFDALATAVLPALHAQADGRALQVWCAGCGNGEEAYTLAMLLEEGGLAGEVLATDIDPGALALAHRGVYGSAALTVLPGRLRERHLRWEAGSASWQVSQAVRRRVRFALHDVTTGLPDGTGPFDLVSCRNVLIYFGPQMQQQVFESLLQGTRKGGFLCLGEAEWPTPQVAAWLQPLGDRIQLFHRLNDGGRRSCGMPG
jgi:chemotaxis methyl-accepting protein methylase